MEIIEKEYINSQLCSECGGKCCKKSGCSYLPKDFVNMNYETLKKEIDKGDISIASILNIYPNKKKKEDLGEELADIAIYLLSLSEMLGFDLEDEILNKMKKNKKRVYKEIDGVNVRISD